MCGNGVMSVSRASHLLTVRAPTPSRAAKSRTLSRSASRSSFASRPVQRYTCSRVPHPLDREHRRQCNPGQLRQECATSAPPDHSRRILLRAGLYPGLGQDEERFSKKVSVKFCLTGRLHTPAWVCLAGSLLKECRELMPPWLSRWCKARCGCRYHRHSPGKQIMVPGKVDEVMSVLEAARDEAKRMTAAHRGLTARGRDAGGT